MMKIIAPLILFPLLKLNLNLVLFSLSLWIMLIFLKYDYVNMIIFSKFSFLDSLSSIMILLTLTSITLIMLSSNFFKKFYLLTSLILVILVMTFLSSNIFLFYILFELVLIPTLLLITKLGYQPERLQASIYLMIYTILASLPLLLGILYMKFFTNFLSLYHNNFQVKISLIFMLAFLVKLPMFFSHLWLPKAHTEAPVEGSMILAAVLLKLGGYGLIRFAPLLFSKIFPFNTWILSISLIGAMITSMNCIRQKDLKSLIAYSSVAHMGLVLASIMTFSCLGMKGAILMMVAHGLSSSALFLLVNMIYTKYHTRNILSIKGLWTSFPNITFWWFIFIAANISAPPSINLASEIFMLMSLLNFNLMIMLPFIFISIMTSIFSINLFLNSIHSNQNLKMSDFSLNKLFLSMFIHSIPLIMIILKMEMF